MIVEKLLHIALLGSTWVLYLLIALSALSIGTILERVIFFRKRSSDATLRPALLSKLRADDWSGLDATLAKSTTVEASVLRSALSWREGGSAAFADALESETVRARTELERSSNLLGTLGNNAPFIGLFGTVIGVIEAFNHLGTSTARAGNMGNVMSGIAEALIATAVGIFVAIPAVIAFNNIQKKVGEIEDSIQSLGKLVTAHLKSHEYRFSHAPRLGNEVVSVTGSPAAASSDAGNGAGNGAGNTHSPHNVHAD